MPWCLTELLTFKVRIRAWEHFDVYPQAAQMPDVDIEVMNNSFWVLRLGRELLKKAVFC